MYNPSLSSSSPYWSVPTYSSVMSSMYSTQFNGDLQTDIYKDSSLYKDSSVYKDSNLYKDSDLYKDSISQYRESLPTYKDSSSLYKDPISPFKDSISYKDSLFPYMESKLPKLSNYELKRGPLTGQFTKTHYPTPSLSNSNPPQNAANLPPRDFMQFGRDLPPLTPTAANSNYFMPQIHVWRLQPTLILENPVFL